MFTRMTKSFNQLSSTLRSGYNNASFEAEVQATIAAPQAFEVIAVMGPTGCGKSTFINTLCPGQVKVGHDLSSCNHSMPPAWRFPLIVIPKGTEEIVEAKCEIDGKPVVLVDTPGFNDTNQRNRSDTVILEKLMDFMRESWEEKMLLSGVIYLHDLTEARMTGSNVTNLRMFRSLCGGDGLRNVFLTLTKWNETPLEDAERRQRELESPGGFWGPYLAGGSKICRFMNTKESAEDLVREILRGRRFIPQIQEETMKGKSVKQTEAGSLLNKALDELREAHAKETEALKAELARSASQSKCQIRMFSHMDR